MPIGEDGHGLSGGQKQVVGLARLTLRQPQVVLLDEPTSGLDEMSERAALQAVAEWAREKTMVVVTHRPQVLPFVQRVVVVDQGRVVLDGPRDAVLKRLGAGNAPAATMPTSTPTPTQPTAPRMVRVAPPARPAPAGANPRGALAPLQGEADGR